MLCSMRGRQEDDASADAGQALDHGTHGGRRDGPDKEHGADPIQGYVQRFGIREIAADNLDVRRQTCGFRSP